MKFNSLEKKCLSCIHASLTSNYRVKCRCCAHPGIIGGTGTEWVKYCYEYSPNTTGLISKEEISYTQIKL